MRVVAALDKFRGTVTAREAAEAVERAARTAGWSCVVVPMADGGEGTLDALGGPNRSTTVSGPVGDPVEAAWRLTRGTAVIETAAAAGLSLVGGAEGNDPIAASTYGVGELILTAVESGARRVLLGMGGSATTDGGWGALRALYPTARFKAIELVAGCDVRTHFVDAAEVFSPQKGATPAQVRLLTGRLERLAQVYRDEYGFDVVDIDGSGAAGGLAGGLAAIGAELVSGFDLVADEVDLDAHLEGADLVVTGEGFIDEQSFDGKVVGGVVERAAQHGVDVVAVAGQVYDEADEHVSTISLLERFGEEAAFDEASRCIEEVVAELLSRRGS
jgi:glycerate kinase